MRIWRLIVVVMGVMIVTGALGAGVGGLIAFAMPESTAAIINARPDRWLSPPPRSGPEAEFNPGSRPAEAAANDPAKSDPGPPEQKPKAENPPAPHRIPIMSIDERVARAAALAGALSLPLGGVLGLMLAILDQFMVYSRTAMSMVAGPGIRRVSTTKFTPPPTVSL